MVRHASPRSGVLVPDATRGYPYPDFSGVSASPAERCAHVPFPPSRDDRGMSDLTAAGFAEHVRHAVWAERRKGNRFGSYTVESVDLAGDLPDTSLVIRANGRRVGKVGWRIALFDGDSEWERLRSFGLYADVNAFVSEIIVELDEGIDGDSFSCSDADEQGVRWVTNRWQS